MKLLAVVCVLFSQIEPISLPMPTFDEVLQRSMEDQRRGIENAIKEAEKELADKLALRFDRYKAKGVLERSKLALKKPPFPPPVCRLDVSSDKPISVGRHYAATDRGIRVPTFVVSRITADDLVLATCVETGQYMAFKMDTDNLEFGQRIDMDHIWRHLGVVKYKNEIGSRITIPVLTVWEHEERWNKLTEADRPKVAEKPKKK